jgi:hypothetical protein
MTAGLADRPIGHPPYALQAAREALRYIEELERRYDVRPADTAGPDTTEAFIAAICGGLSDDFPDAITDADLSNDAPREPLD